MATFRASLEEERVRNERLKRMKVNLLFLHAHSLSSLYQIYFVLVIPFLSPLQIKVYCFTKLTLIYLCMHAFLYLTLKLCSHKKLIEMHTWQCHVLLCLLKLLISFRLALHFFLFFSPYWSCSICRNEGLNDYTVVCKWIITRITEPCI